MNKSILDFAKDVLSSKCEVCGSTENVKKVKVSSFTGGRTANLCPKCAAMERAKKY